MSARILVVDNDPETHDTLRRLLGDGGHEATLVHSGDAAVALLRHAPFDVVMADLSDPGLLQWCREQCEDTPFIAMARDASVEVALEATRQGAYDCLKKPISPPTLATVLESALESRALHQTGQRLHSDTPDGDGWQGLVGHSPQMLTLYRMISRAARFLTPVLVVGESGTGKELIAHAIHASSPRAHRPFVAINGAGIVEGLFESLMFCHRRGSFERQASYRRACP